MGALVSAFMLGLVLPILDSGMPEHVLHLLALTAVAFGLSSLNCHFAKRGPKWLKAIATANGMYCLLTSALVIYFYRELTWLGVAYFVAEILIIVALVMVEIKVAKRTGS